MWPFDDLGDAIGDQIGDIMATAFDKTMKSIWDASMSLLREAFKMLDQFSTFTVDIHTGPVAVLWPMMLWISGVLALGLFFWQLLMTNLRGGRGFMRLVTGPVQYGMALAVTVGMVAAFLTGIDGLTAGILDYGLQSKNFSEAFTHTNFGDGAMDYFKSVEIGILAIVGIIPSALGYILEMLFREAAIYILVGTIPIVAAGLLAHISSSWFWRVCRWLLACIAMKPVLALALVLGVAIAGGSTGITGLLAGIGVLAISLLCPFVLFSLFAFVDPNSDAGATFRDALSGAGVDSYGANNPAVAMASNFLSSKDSTESDAQENANTERFDSAQSEQQSESTTSDTADKQAATGGQQEPAATDADAEGPSTAGQEAGGAEPPPMNLGQVVSSSPHTGPTGDYDDPPPPDPGGSGGSTPPSPPSGGGGPTTGGGSGGGAAATGPEAAEAAEAAVIV